VARLSGVVGDQTWAISLHAASATLESAVGAFTGVVAGQADTAPTLYMYLWDSKMLFQCSELCDHEGLA
jgi:hypothetical protein